MAPPTTPTKTRICTEALKRFSNGATPENEDITRAEDYGLEKVKRDLMNIGRKWRPLLKTDYDITVAGDADYPNPSDFDSYKTIRLMTGTHTGVLSAVTSTSSITLAAAEDATKVQVDGKFILITSGTGVDQARQCYDYTVATKIALMATAFTTLPVLGDGYMVVNDVTLLTEHMPGIFNSMAYQFQPGTPVRYSVFEDATVGFMRLHPVPNAVFGLERNYYADLMKLDVTEGSTYLYTTILTRWAGLFEQGVYVWALGQDDDRYQVENQTYQTMLMNTAMDDLVGFTPPVKGG